MNKVMRYQIIKPIDMDWKTFGDILSKLRQEVRFTKNKTIALYNDWLTYSLQYKNEHGEYPKLVDYCGYKVFSGYAYDNFKEDIVFSNTGKFISVSKVRLFYIYVFCLTNISTNIWVIYNI